MSIIIEEILAEQSCPECRTIDGHHGFGCRDIRERQNLWADGWADLDWLWPRARRAERDVFHEWQQGPGIGSLMGGFGLSNIFIRNTTWVRFPEGDTADRVAAAAVAHELRPDLDPAVLAEAVRAMSPAGLRSLLRPSGFAVATRCEGEPHRARVVRGRIHQADHPDTWEDPPGQERPRLRRRRWLDSLITTSEVLELDALTVRSSLRDRPSCEAMALAWDVGLMASVVLDLTDPHPRPRSRWPSGLKAAAQVMRTAVHLEVLRQLRAASGTDVVADLMVELRRVGRRPSWGIHQEFSAIYVSVPMNWLWSESHEPPLATDR